MAEQGAKPNVSKARRRALDAVRSLFTPLLPDDYLELINPLWTTQELRGRIERIKRETEDAVTVYVKPGWEWPGHVPGQYVRIGFVIDGVHHWRAYSLTSEPDRTDGLVSDWREREAFLSGPGDMLDAMSEHWEKDGDCDRLHMERFQPIIGEGDGELGEGGTIKFLDSDLEAESDGSQPILVAGEEA